MEPHLVSNIPNFTKEFSCKSEVSTCQKKIFWSKFFFSKIISNHHVCLQTWFLRCLEHPWKLWKQLIYVKTSILLKINRSFEVTPVHLEAWRGSVKLKNVTFSPEFAQKIEFWAKLRFLHRYVAFKAFKEVPNILEIKCEDIYDD